MYCTQIHAKQKNEAHGLTQTMDTHAQTMGIGIQPADTHKSWRHTFQNYEHSHTNNYGQTHEQTYILNTKPYLVLP